MRKDRATNKLLRKMEDVRLTHWLEQEMRKRDGSPEKAKREIFARYASVICLGNGGGVKWIANYDRQFKGPIPVRQALAESRNTVAVWVAGTIGVRSVIRTARQMGIRTPLQGHQDQP